MQKISSCELLCYFFIWISANFYSLFKLFQAQNELLDNNTELKNKLQELIPGWKWLGRHQDVSDIEWFTWKYYFYLSWPFLLMQFSISEIIRCLKPNILHYWYILSSVIFITINLGTKQLIILAAEPILYSIITFSGGKKISLWFTSILLLLTYNSLKYKELFWSILNHEELVDEEIYLVLFTIGWIQLRCICFCFDYIDKKDKLSCMGDKMEENEFSTFNNIVKMFSYVLYLPLLHSGPLILYSEFEKSFTVRTNFYSRLRNFIINIITFIIYKHLLDFSLHFMYFYAMQEEMLLIRQLPTMALCGGGLWMGLSFHLKYVTSYGVAGSYASLDNIETPPLPRCISRVHIYSQMWRYFDVGLYKFLTQYIYKPCLEVISKFENHLSHCAHKLMASFMTFLFIFLWHGITWDIFVWTVLNFIGITLESLSKIISETDMYDNFKTVVLKTEAMEQRFIAVLCTPLLALSAISNFYLFAGHKVGNLFFDCFFHPSLWNSVIVFVSIYACCHVSMALENKSARSVVIKRKTSVHT